MRKLPRPTDSPHFLGYSGFSEGLTEGKIDLREQPDIATKLAAGPNRDEVKPYWRLRGPNQWSSGDDEGATGFRSALEGYIKGVGRLGYEFAHPTGEAFEIPICTIPG
ncbi:hypothetical protein HOY80DRAFT_979713 [Tuber brumale]|nr:hypothetical protein HOY80DRAFT_979713 [Tuber brumale]